ncbi:transposable element Tcb2 transposase [Trichonephila clavipes]|nr:transposable element Tcb2 transposase [Trichonephila clavipes]
MEAVWSSREVARQLGHSDRVERRCWDQWIGEMSFTRRPGSGRPRQTSRREHHHVYSAHSPMSYRSAILVPSPPRSLQLSLFSMAAPPIKNFKLPGESYMPHQQKHMRHLQ